ncbi:MAG: helix-turn-helix domain-containing protein [Pseudomonadota bacterium]|nr:helix-turn-helix domain-containing protein [Pseudomonadota bacterium]
MAAWKITSNDNPLAEEFYRSGIRDWYGVLHLDADRTFFTENLIYQFGDYVIGRGRSVGQMLVRGPDEIRRSGLDSVAVMLDLAGMKGDADGRDVNAPPGSFHLRDLARPSAFKVDAVDAIVLAMPRDRAPAWLVDRNIHGLSIDRTPQISRLLTGHLMALLQAAPGLSVEEGVTSVEAALVMVERAFRNTGNLTASQSEAVYRRLRASAVVLIDQRLHEPDLKIDQLIRILGASRATLFRAFASSGGINFYIKQRRLERARDALLAREGRHPSVAEIGRAHGFISESHFSRSFQDQFGHRPGARQTPAPPPPPGDSGRIRYDLFLDWLGGG